MRRLLLGILCAGIAAAATNVSKATGNFTAAGTWGVGEAGASAIQTTRSANTNTTTSYVYSSAFTCTNLDVIDGILVYGRRLNTTGTVSVALSDDNGTTATRELAINASDMDDDDSFHFFLFASTLACDGGTDYKVGIKGSSAANATFYRDGTAGNWFRVPRTTATGAPAAADILYVTGDLTGAGTGNSFTVTMDSTAATVFGAVAATESLGVGVRGTLSYGTAAATAYDLNIAGTVRVAGGGTFNMGTSGTPIPTGSSGFLDFDLASNVDSGLICENGSTCNFYGATKTTTSTLLNTDEAAAATVIGVVATTGWEVSDELAFAPTTRTASEAEKKTVLTVDSGTQVTLTAGLTNAHSGTSPAQAEVANITRNVRIRGESDTLQAYFQAAATAVVTKRYVEFYRLGSATAGKTGIVIDTTTGTYDAQFCALHDFIVAGSRGFDVRSTSGSNITISTNVTYNIQGIHFLNTAGTGVQTVTGNVFIRSVGDYAVYIRDLGLTFTSNTVTGSAFPGVALIESGASPTGTFSMTTHSNNGCGTEIQASQAFGSTYTFTSITSWRNNGGGLCTLSTLAYFNIVINAGSFFGNLNQNIAMPQVSTPWRLTMTGVTLSGDSTFSTANGFQASNNTGYGQILLYNCDFGSASGIRTAHTTSDIHFDNSNNFVQVAAYNTKLASTTPVLNLGVSVATEDVASFVKVQRFGQTAGDHRAWLYAGTARTDTSIFQTTSPSLRLTPISASVKLEFGIMDSTVNSGGTTTWSVGIRKSAAGDGAAYNGNQPQLVILKNPALGLDADSVCDTATVGTGTWETLTCTSPSATDNGVFTAVLRVDGTTGWVNASDAVMTGPTAGHGEKYWKLAEPFSPRVGGAGAGAAGGSFTFVN